MINGHKISRKITKNEFTELLQDYTKTDIIVSEHTLFRLAEKQRKIYKDIIIKLILTEKTPEFVGIQNNGLYACFYKYNNEIFRIILNVKPSKIKVVTFYIVNTIPEI